MMRNSRLIAYASVHGGKSFLWAGEDVLSLYILISLVKTAPAEAGVAFLIASFWNAALDTLWSVVIRESDAVRRHLPAISASAALVACLSFGALPLLPPGSVGSGIAVIILFRTAFSLIDVPHNGMTVAMADTYGHLAIARLRAIGSSAAGLLIGLLAIPVLAAGSGFGFVAREAIVVISLIALLMIAPLPWLIARTPAPLASAAVGKANPLSRSILGFVLPSLIGFAAIGALTKALLHIEAPMPDTILLVPLILAAGRLLGTWAWSSIASRLGNAVSLRLSYAACALTVLPLPAAILLGSGVSIVILLLSGIALGGVGLISWARLSELSIVHGGTDTPTATVHYAVFTTASKLGIGASGAIVGLWLAASGDAAHVLPAQLWSLILLASTVCLAVALFGLRGGTTGRAFGSSASDGGERRARFWYTGPSPTRFGTTTDR